LWTINDALNVAPASAGSFEMPWRIPGDFLKISCIIGGELAGHRSAESAMLGILGLGTGISHRRLATHRALEQ
jgi:hypothetical protein